MVAVGQGGGERDGQRRARGEVVQGVQPDPGECLGGAVEGRTLNARPRDRFATASQTITNYVADHGRVPFAPSNNLCCRTEVVLGRAFARA